MKDIILMPFRVFFALFGIMMKKFWWALAIILLILGLAFRQAAKKEAEKLVRTTETAVAPSAPLARTATPPAVVIPTPAAVTAEVVPQNIGEVTYSWEKYDPNLPWTDEWQTHPFPTTEEISVWEVGYIKVMYSSQTSHVEVWKSQMGMVATHLAVCHPAGCKEVDSRPLPVVVVYNFPGNGKLYITFLQSFDSAGQWLDYGHWVVAAISSP